MPRSSLTTPTRHRAIGAVGAVAIVLLFASSCSGSDKAVATSGTQSPRVGTTQTLGTTPAIAAKCEEALLLTAVREKHAQATINDVTCANGDAVLTIVGPTGVAGDAVGILTGKNGTWQLLASGPVDGNSDGLLPASFSVILYNAWRDKYDARVHPTTTVSRPARPGTTTRSSGTTPEQSRCYKESNGYRCIPPSTTTTTTRPPTTVTTLPPTTVTTVAPTIPPPTPPSGPSAFCKARPLDANCLANPAFPG